ncbi:uncharacterized protein LOC112567115 [Pomacea canaliculata]|uniref:uncharacterized protein LOC112567115 n=1 Tax=Pomacea canaliculata TaxID=400727 RepID=UPI000D72AA05|nr:uncharacterized protein LOC112567115 [Pomacea canaliculata]
MMSSAVGPASRTSSRGTKQTEFARKENINHWKESIGKRQSRIRELLIAAQRLGQGESLIIGSTRSICQQMVKGRERDRDKATETETEMQKQREIHRKREKKGVEEIWKKNSERERPVIHYIHGHIMKGRVEGILMAKG